MADQEKPRPARPGDVIEASFIKSNNFHVVWADGVWGGMTTRGLFALTFYNERTAIPRASQLTVGADGTVSEIVTETREGVVREIEVTVMMAPEMAAEFHRWLGQRIEEHRSMQAQANARL